MTMSSAAIAFMSDTTSTRRSYITGYMFAKSAARQCIVPGARPAGQAMQAMLGRVLRPPLTHHKAQMQRMLRHRSLVCRPNMPALALYMQLLAY